MSLFRNANFLFVRIVRTFTLLVFMQAGAYLCLEPGTTVVPS